MVPSEIWTQNPIFKKQVEHRREIISKENCKK